jgi:hypothetical protein
VDASGRFLIRGLANVGAEFSLTALAYNLRRALNILGVEAMGPYPCRYRTARSCVDTDVNHRMMAARVLGGHQISSERELSGGKTTY